jgi:hypothetical protein
LNHINGQLRANNWFNPFADLNSPAWLSFFIVDFFAKLRHYFVEGEIMQENNQLEQAQKQQPQPPIKKKSWYKSWWGILLIILGVIIAVPVVMLFIVVGVLMFAQDSGTNPSTNQTDKTSSSQPVDESKIPYEGVEIWKIGDNGLGTTIVIDPKYDNVESLKQLGSELNEENQSRQFAMNYVYTNETSALYRSESFCSPSQSSTIRAHKQNWAALYQKDNSGAKMTIFTDRSCDSDTKNKIISY